jgi:hypothetical protein
VNSQATHLVIVKRGLADRCREQGLSPPISECDITLLEHTKTTRSSVPGPFFSQIAAPFCDFLSGRTFNELTRVPISKTDFTREVQTVCK